MKCLVCPKQYKYKQARLNHMAKEHTFHPLVWLYAIVVKVFK